MKIGRYHHVNLKMISHNCHLTLALDIPTIFHYSETKGCLYFVSIFCCPPLSYKKKVMRMKKGENYNFHICLRCLRLCYFICERYNNCYFYAGCTFRKGLGLDSFKFPVLLRFDVYTIILLTKTFYWMFL